MPTDPRSDAEALLPCPFCGGEALVDDSLPPNVSVDCLRCGAGRTQGTEAEVVAAWNRRASAPRQEADKLLRRLLNAHGSESDFDGEQWDDALAAARAYLTVAAPPPPNVIESTDGLGGKHYHRVVGTTETGIVIEAAPPPPTDCDSIYTPPEDNEPWYCTLPARHAGDHVAMVDDEEVSRWPNVAAPPPEER